MKTCPLNKVVTRDGPWAIRLANWIGVNAPALAPLLIPVAVWLDDVLGYGKRVAEQKWWLDHEYVDGRIVMAPGVNRRDIEPRKPVPKRHRVALYPAENLPPGDARGSVPVDRKEALAKGDEALRPENAP
jgi:hypothetical protein